jgi:hypothetical protein
MFFTGAAGGGRVVFVLTLQVFFYGVPEYCLWFLLAQ